MPCSDPYVHEDYYSEYQRVTRIACDMAKFINRTVEHLSPETILWIVEHEKLDKARTDDSGDGGINILGGGS